MHLGLCIPLSFNFVVFWLFPLLSVVLWQLLGKFLIKVENEHNIQKTFTFFSTLMVSRFSSHLEYQS